MRKEAFDEIMEGVRQAQAHYRGEPSDVRVRKIELPEVDVPALRQRLDMTQDEFADRLLLNLATLRGWEQGRREPDGPTLVLLNLIERRPKLVMEELEKLAIERALARPQRGPARATARVSSAAQRRRRAPAKKSARTRRTA